jgi:peroxiredoxin
MTSSSPSPSLSPIADAVAARRAAYAVENPDAAPTAYALEQAALAATGVPAGVLRPGEAFPRGELLDALGEITSIDRVAAGRAAVVVFYRGSWCPYCNLALGAYRSALAGPLAERGVALIAVSPQHPDGSLSMAEKHGLDFAVLSDPGNRLGAGLGILMQPSEAARAEQLSHGLDIAERNADGTTTLPMPTVAIVDADGILRWIDVHPDYSTRTEPAAVLDALTGLGL